MSLEGIDEGKNGGIVSRLRGVFFEDFSFAGDEDDEAKSPLTEHEYESSQHNLVEFILYFCRNLIPVLAALTLWGWCMSLTGTAIQTQ